MPRLQLTITVYYPDQPHGPADDARARDEAWYKLDRDVKAALRHVHEVIDQELKDPGRGISCMISQAPVR